MLHQYIIRLSLYTFIFSTPTTSPDTDTQHFQILHYYYLLFFNLHFLHLNFYLAKNKYFWGSFSYNRNIDNSIAENT